MCNLSNDNASTFNAKGPYPDFYCKVNYHCQSVGIYLILMRFVAVCVLHDMTSHTATLCKILRIYNKA